MTERTIFLAALEIGDAAERSAHLDEACGEDDELRRRVEELLHSHEAAGSFLQGNAQADAATVEFSPMTEGPGTVIGNYKLMEQIGEGGMGVVYIAQQQQPVKRKVALKIIKPGMDTNEVIARFEAERQALALMDHPNIARVLDGGATETGRPYFVMELVRGIPITDYCDQNKVSPRERLELFGAVCQAIQHAHQKGIIHRDVKPSNVLVTLHDVTPVAKVIDFGVAKAINQQLTERTIYTRSAQMVGTPLYMSPEQAGKSGLDVDTRTDIYSLGVLLYELLTGTTPFDKERIHEAAYDEIQRIIREEEPPKPSTKISTLGETATDVSSHRSTDPGRLYQLVRGDLDWIVMKALEKDRTRRYPTANGFAADVQRFLDDEPIEARPPSTAYRIRKFVRRNKGPVAAVLAVILALIVGILGTTIGLVRATDLAAELQQRTDELKKKTDELQQVITRHRQLLIDHALLIAMSGDAQRTEQAIRDAELAGAPPYWLEMLRGQVALYGGNESEAIRHLKQAIELNDASVAARAMLSVAYEYGGYEQSVDVDEKAAVTAEDHLFFAQAMRAYPENALEHVDRSTALRHTPLASAIRAEILSHHAMQSGDYKTATKAVAEIEAAQTLTNDNPFVLGIGLLVYHVAMRLSSEIGEPSGKLRDKADALAVQLEEFPDYRIACGIRAWYHDYVGDEEAVTRALNGATKGRIPNVYMETYLAFLYRKGKRDLALSLLDRDRSEEPLRMTEAFLLAETTKGRQQLQKRFAEWDANYKWETKLDRGLLLAPFILGNSKTGKRKSKECLEQLDFTKEFGKYAKGAQNLIELLAGVTSPEPEDPLEDRTRGHLQWVHYFLGILELSDGKRDAAREHFEKCVEIGVFSTVSYQVSRALLARMQQSSDFPDWIPGKHPTE